MLGADCLLRLRRFGFARALGLKLPLLVTGEDGTALHAQVVPRPSPHAHLLALAGCCGGGPAEASGEAQAGVSSLSVVTRAAGGYRLLDSLGLFAFTSANARKRMAGIGARWTFGL